MTDARVPIDLLLAHRAWVRAVARALSQGDADADDLEQDAWVAAIEGPPEHEESLRGWLRGVLRRRAAMRVRGDVRRDRRERTAARPEGEPRAADDLVAAAESHARVAQAVVSLPEPFRTAVLLRFFEGLPPREVAARTGVPVETARSRIKRALVLLREALGGDDERVAFVVAPLLGTWDRPPVARHVRPGPGSTVSAAAAGGIALGVGAKFVAAAAVVVGLAAAWWWSTDERTPERAAASAENVAVVPAPPRETPRVRVRDAAETRTADGDSPPAEATPVPAVRTIRWRVVGGEVPTPATGSVLPVEQDLGAIGLPPGPRTVRVDGDDLVSEGFGRGTIQGFAVAPDGSRAKLFAKDGDERGLDTRFLRERTIVVTLVEPDGSPAVGVPLQLNNPGNIAIRSGVRTDSVGRVAFAGLSPKDGRLDVHLVGENQYVTRYLGTLDTAPGDVSVTWTVPAARDVTLRLTVDGERRIPPGCRISATTASVDGREDDESRGDVRLRVRPVRDGAEFRGSIAADGRAPAAFTVPAGHGPVTIDVVVPRGVAFVGRIASPTGTEVRVGAVQPPRTGFNVELQRRFPPEGAWSRVFPPGELVIDGVAPDADGFVRFAPLRLGAYRLRETTTGATSAEADLSEDGAESTVVSLDLSRAGTVRGRIETEGGNSGDERVVVEGVPDPMTGDPSRRVVKPAADGSFETWIPGDRPLRLRAEHPLLRPDPTLGEVEVTKPADGVVLRLVKGPTVAFGLPGVTMPNPFTSVRVLFFHGEPAGEPSLERNAVAAEGRYRAGGFEPGTWTLWIDAPGHAPATLRGVVLGEGTTDLGDVVLDPGLSLRVRIATFPNEVAPRIGVSVSRKDGPRFSRSAGSNGEADVVVRGLVPGTYEVFVFPQTGSFPSDFTTAVDPPYMRRTVVVGASGESVVDYSPR